MGDTRTARRWSSLSLLLLLAAAMSTSCATRPADKITAPAASPSTPAPTAPTAPTAPVEPGSTAFPAPPGQAKRVAERVAVGLVAFDTRTDDAEDFLHEVRPYTTGTALDSLAASARARLPWRAMRARGERVALAVTGTSTSRRQRDQLHVVVTGIATTRIDVAVLRHPVELRLRLARTPRGWKVDGVYGSGS